MKTYRYNIFFLWLLTLTFGAAAQEKLSETHKTDAKVRVVLQVSHTNIVVETWNRDEVKIQAYLEEKERSPEETQQLLQTWNLETSGSPRRVSINSHGGSSLRPQDMLQNLASAPEMPEMPDMAPLLEAMPPLLEQIPQHPFPAEALEGITELKFDFQAYREKGEAYLEEWEQQVEEKFGDGVQVRVQEWASGVGDTVRRKEYEERMEAWRQQMASGMAAARERFEAQIGPLMERMQQQMLSTHGNFFAGKKPGSGNIRAQRTIKIQMPESGELRIRSRHGEVRLEGETKNLIADISQGKLFAESITGKDTRINASYTPLKIGDWQDGQLQISYTSSCEIQRVRSLKLDSNSSDLKIGEIQEAAVISGTFGKIQVEELAPDFHFLDFTLNNSDLSLELPDSALQFVYYGSRSQITYPESLQAEEMERYGTRSVRGHLKDPASGGTVNIKANFSNIEVKENF